MTSVTKRLTQVNYCLVCQCPVMPNFPSVIANHEKTKKHQRALAGEKCELTTDKIRVEKKRLNDKVLDLLRKNKDTIDEDMILYLMGRLAILPNEYADMVTLPPTPPLAEPASSMVELFEQTLGSLSPSTSAEVP